MDATPAHRRFHPGDPVPWFFARGSSNPRYSFGSVAGRNVVLCFFGSAATEANRRLLDAVLRLAPRFDDLNIAFFGVSIDPEDERARRVTQRLPGIRYFWDDDRQLSRQYGALRGDDAPAADPPIYDPFILVLDPLLRVFASLPFDEQGAATLGAVLDRLPPPDARGIEAHAPVLILPRIFEPGFCRGLISLYETHGGEESGFMREIEGKTVALIDPSHKRRQDYEIEDANIRDAARRRIVRKLVPEVEKAFQFKATRMERYIVACYDAALGGHFRPHRDNTTKGTAHRRFAVTINLNAEAYEGGDLRFPEFGSRTYRAPTGGAVVFSCSLLHEATPVSAGRRFAFLPFLYDDAAARLRAANNPYLGDGTEPYRGGAPPANADDERG